MSNNIYNILGKLKGITDNAALTPETEATTVYESVDARGSITEAVKSLEAKYQTFKEAKDKPDFLDVDKDGDKKEPMKKAAKDKNNARGAMKDMFGGDAKDLTSKLKIKEGQGPYTLDDPKHPKFKANYEKFKKSNPDCKLADFVAAMKKKEKNLSEAAYDEPAPVDADAVAKRKRLQALKDRQEDERAERGDKTNTPIRKVAGKAYGGAAQKDDDKDELDEAVTPPKPAFASYLGDAEWAEMVAQYGLAGAEKQARLASPEQRQNQQSSSLAYAKNQAAIKDLNDPMGKEKAQSQMALDRIKTQGDQLRRTMQLAKGQNYSMHSNELGQIGQMSTVWNPKDANTNYRTQPGQVRLTGKNTQPAAARPNDDLDEGVQFGDKIDNSKAEMKKAKLAKLKESRVMEETDYFYEKVAKSLCAKNSTLDTAGSEFADAVRKEMVAQGIDPNRARNILLMDEDFLMDVASSYGHYCKEVAECGAPMNSHLGGVSELDEIAQLAGLSVPTRDQAMGLERSSADELDEAQGVNINGKEINVGSIEVEGVNSWDRPDFADAYITYAEFMDGTPLSDEELVQLEQQHGDLVNQAAHDSLEGSGDFLEEEDDFPAPPPEKNYVLEKEDDDFPAPPPEKNYVLEKEIGEGNEFSGALAAAKASGAKEFEVAGKRYTVKEDINVNITANGQEDALNLFRKLAGMDKVTAQPVIQAVELPQDAESAIARGVVDAVDEERDPEYVNSPREQTAGIDAAIPSGNDLHATKRAYKIAQPGDNPMAVAEAKDTSWSKYTSMLKGLLK